MSVSPVTLMDDLTPSPEIPGVPGSARPRTVPAAPVPLALVTEGGAWRNSTLAWRTAYRAAGKHPPTGKRPRIRAFSDPPFSCAFTGQVPGNW